MPLRGPYHLPSAWPSGGPGLGGPVAAMAGRGILVHGTPCLPAPLAQPGQPRLRSLHNFYFFILSLFLEIGGKRGKFLLF